MWSDRHVVWRLLGLAWPLGCVSMLNALSSTLPRFLLERSHGECELGVFAAAASLMLAGQQVVAALRSPPVHTWPICTRQAMALAFAACSYASCCLRSGRATGLRGGLVFRVRVSVGLLSSGIRGVYRRAGVADAGRHRVLCLLLLELHDVCGQIPEIQLPLLIFVCLTAGSRGLVVDSCLRSCPAPRGPCSPPRSAK